MQTRIVIVAGSVVLALLVLVAAYLLDPLANRPSGQPGGGGAPPTAAETGGDGALGPGQQGRLERREAGRRTILTWATLDPQPEGRARVTDPSARIEFSPQRVMTIEADRGRIYAPNNQPREGHFKGQVEVTLYRTRQDRPVSLTGTDDVVMRVYLKEADFDLELGQLDSAGPVHVTGPRVDFRGRGLTMNYNELHERLQRLRIHEGNILRLRGRPIERAKASTQPRPEPDSATQPGPVAAGDNTSEGEPAGPGSADQTGEPGETTETDSAGPPQFYRARFHERVRIRAEAQSVRMRGRQLDAVFSFNKQQTLETASRPGQPASQPRPPEPLAAPRPATQPAADDGSAAGAENARPTDGDDRETSPPATQVATTQPAGSQPDEPFGESLLQRTEQDVVIRWDGPLVVTPEPEPPVDLEGGEDMLLALSGKPATVLGKNRSRVSAERLSYRAGSGRLTAVGSEARPLSIEAPDMGRLTGRRAVINPAGNSGYIDGPGTLKASIDRSNQTGSATDSATTGAGDAPAEPLTVAWRDRLNLRFAAETTAEAQTNSEQASPDKGAKPADTSPTSGNTANGDDSTGQLKLGQLGALRTASFNGNVRTRHPRFNMTGRHLTVRFISDPTRGLRPTVIEATGAVRMKARESENTTPAELSANQIDISLSPDEAGRINPTGLTARREVTLSRPDLTLKANRLDATLRAREANKQTAQADEPASLFESRTVRLLPRDPFAAPDASDISLEPRDTQNTASAARMPARLDYLVAERNVKVTVQNPALTMTGDRLELQPNPQRMTLIGSANQPATVRQPEGELTGRRIRFHQARQTVEVPGPGQFSFQMTRGQNAGQTPQSNNSNSPNVSQRDAQNNQANNTTTTLHTRWQQSMRYDHRAGRAELRGQVKADTQSDDQQTHLACQQLDLTFNQTPRASESDKNNESTATDSASQKTNPQSNTTVGNQPDNNAPGTEPSDGPALMQGDRQLASLTARRQVVFTARSTATNAAGKPHTRLRLEGPKLRFTRNTERVVVTGQGRMLIEDHRPAETGDDDKNNASKKAEANDQPEEAGDQNADESGQSQETEQANEPRKTNASAVNFTGRGETLFTWQGALTLDADKSDMLIEDRVWMIHRPAGQGQTMTLDCDRLLADLTDTGGLGMWQSNQAPDPALRYVQADRNVIIQHAARTIRADHLKYRQQRNELALWAEGQRYVKVQRDDQPTDLQAKRIEWNLRTNQLDATGVRGGATPLPE